MTAIWTTLECITGCYEYYTYQSFLVYSLSGCSFGQFIFMQQSSGGVGGYSGYIEYTRDHAIYSNER